MTAEELKAEACKMDDSDLFDMVVYLVEELEHRNHSYRLLLAEMDISDKRE